MPEQSENGVMSVRKEAPRLTEELTQKTFDLLGTYTSTLLKSSDEMDVEDLGHRSMGEAEVHIAQLAELQGFLETLMDNPASMVLRNQVVNENSGISIANLSLKNVPVFGEGAENAQKQIKLYARLPFDVGDTDADVYSAGMGRDPGQALDYLSRSDRDGLIRLSTVSVYKDPESGATKYDAHAGVQVSLGRGKLSYEGIKFVGTLLHRTALHPKNRFTSDDIELYQRLTLGLAQERRQEYR